MLTVCLWFICFLCLGWVATLAWVMVLLCRGGRDVWHNGRMRKGGNQWLRPPR